MKRKYLLDTNICVFCMRGKFEMNRKIALAGIDNCYLSEITVAELYYGAENRHCAEGHNNGKNDTYNPFRN